jgi:hypothetical protein
MMAEKGQLYGLRVSPNNDISCFGRQRIVFAKQISHAHRFRGLPAMFSAEWQKARTNGQ